MREMETTPRGSTFVLALTPASIEPVAHGTDSMLSLIQNFISLAISSWYIKTHSQIRSNWKHCRGQSCTMTSHSLNLEGKIPQEDPRESCTHPVSLELEEG